MKFRFKAGVEAVLVLKGHVAEFKCFERSQLNWMLRLRLHRQFQQLFKVAREASVSRYTLITFPSSCSGPKMKKDKMKARKLSDAYTLRKDQVEHQEKDRKCASG